MKRLTTLIAAIMLVPFFVQAQDLADALRYSEFQVQGTARAGAMGNAFGALGGDFTSVSINPAGLGLYRADELVLTPTFGQSKVESSYFGNTMNDSKYNFSLNNLSYVSAIQTGNQSETGLVNLNVGIGYNRVKDFNNNMLAGATNPDGSFLDYMADNATVGNWSDFYEQLAWDTYLLWKEDNSDVYWHDLDSEGANYGQSQRKSITKQGYMNEYSLALGMNFNHKLYLGASIGIVDVFYKETSELLEWDEQNRSEFFNEMQFDSYLRTSGTGYNGKIGVIFKPINEIRLGASVHTPTFYNLHDVFETSMYSNAADEEGVMGNFEAQSPYSEYDYDLESPLRATLSGAFVIAKKGLLSIDYEFVDYASANLRRGGDGYQFVDENDEISEVYRSVGNLRVGGELLATSSVSLRAGFEYYPSAYNENAFGVSQPNADVNTNIYSAGLGYRSGGFFFDLAYRYTDTGNYDSLYPAPPTDFYNMPEMAHFNTTKNNVRFTFGFKF
ncbi:Outer membrane protein transport protein (OMPP1/FadL/TodX) [Tangfeifania diversioriginum]|uniref:Outer membrane protein transport protein (OMPP1/FadL/TodX) n=1 Tax=Tangfeifania diversioriginum TaxID=1168035 RepID=A0A1M6E669_9BACT|nr:outer membrane protein transport protein [Tangfeifania diversioriginum]SHI80997.1 Outer membrane protein transport protein (OMPP1/FadL/TodX) [Tangfeifania diversioriginum]